MGRIVGIEPNIKIIGKDYLIYRSKTFKKDNYFVLYDLNDNIVGYFDNFEDLSRILKYRLSDLVHEYNRNNTDNIIVIIDNNKYKLATFC